MSELRWNPLLRTYTMVASNRQARPDMPKDWCPFCPGEGKKVPPDYEVFSYDNDFPALKLSPDEMTVKSTGIYNAVQNYGKCEVILYSPDHNAKLYELSQEHIVKLIHLWKGRFIELSKDEKIKYIFEFENRGEEVGVTMPHPHGQLYAYPWIPLKIKTELDSCCDYYNEHSKCLICSMNDEEKEFGERVIFENSSFMAYLPFFTDYPYGVFITSKRHIDSFVGFMQKEEEDLADILKNITGAFDNLFDRPFPYMMCIHQSPVNSEWEYKDNSRYFHFHIEFYTPLRDKKRIKWYASSEMGGWAAANTMNVEDSAKDLRAALEKFLKKR